MSRNKIYMALFLVCLTFSLSACSPKQEANNINEVSAQDLIVADGLTLHINDAEYADQVVPPNPLGYYDYYPAAEGWRYLILSGNVVNTREESVIVDNCEVTGIVDSAIREGKLRVMNESGMELLNEIPAGAEEWGFYLFVAIKVGEEPDKIGIAFNEGWKQENEIWDNQILIDLSALPIT